MTSPIQVAERYLPMHVCNRCHTQGTSVEITAYLQPSGWETYNLCPLCAHSLFLDLRGVLEKQ